MTDIEKRAESSVTFRKFEEGMDEMDVFLHNILMHGRREGYIKGAKEQKAIDDDHLREATKMVIDKACSWLKENLGYYNRDEVHIGKSYEQCVIDDFRKSMEYERYIYGRQESNIL